MTWPVSVTLDIVSGTLMVLLGLLLLLADPRKDWNRLFALFSGFWGAQIVAANLVRVLTTQQAALLAGEVSLAFLLPLYFFVTMFVAVFPRPRAPFGTRPSAVLLLLVPAVAALVALSYETDRPYAADASRASSACLRFTSVGLA